MITLMHPFRQSRKQGRLRSSSLSFRPQLEALGGLADFARPAARPIETFRPDLEALEARLVPTGVVPTDQTNTTYVLLQNGTLYQHIGTDSSTGWYFIWNNVRQVSAGEDPHANPVAFVLLNDGTLYEHQGLDSSTGWSYIWYGVHSVTGTAWGSDDCFVVLNNGTAYEHVGVGTSNWSFIWNNVRQISAGKDGSNNPAAFVVLNDGTLWEHQGRSSSTGWSFVYNNVYSVSASQLVADDVFVLFNNNTAYEHVGVGTSNWYFIWNNVTQVSAGGDSSYNSACYILLNNGTVYLHAGRDSSTGWQYIWYNTNSISASEIDPYTVYIHLADGTAYENNDGTWHYVWYGVAA